MTDGEVADAFASLNQMRRLAREAAGNSGKIPGSHS